MINQEKLQQFLGKMMVDLGAAISVPLVRTGIRLGLYKAMDGAGPMTSAEFAVKTNISERYAREWLAQNAASGYLSYDPGSRRFELPPEQAMVFADEEGPCFMGGGFGAVAALYQTQPFSHSSHHYVLLLLERCSLARHFLEKKLSLGVRVHELELSFG